MYSYHWPTPCPCALAPNLYNQDLELNRIYIKKKTLFHETKKSPISTNIPKTTIERQPTRYMVIAPNGLGGRWITRAYFTYFSFLQEHDRLSRIGQKTDHLEQEVQSWPPWYVTSSPGAKLFCVWTCFYGGCCFCCYCCCVCECETFYSFL